MSKSFEAQKHLDLHEQLSLAIEKIDVAEGAIHFNGYATEQSLQEVKRLLQEAREKVPNQFRQVLFHWLKKLRGTSGLDARDRLDIALEAVRTAKEMVDRVGITEPQSYMNLLETRTNLLTASALLKDTRRTVPSRLTKLLKLNVLRHS